MPPVRQLECELQQSKRREQQLLEMKHSLEHKYRTAILRGMGAVSYLFPPRRSPAKPATRQRWRFGARQLLSLDDNDDGQDNITRCLVTTFSHS